MGLSRLRAAYRATCYRLVALGIVLRVDRRSPELDQWLRRRKLRRWAVLTAWNPRSRQLSRRRNQSQQNELLAVLAHRGYETLPACNIPRGAARRWTEESVFVPGIPLTEARRLARRFAQNALLAGRNSRPARLVFVYSQPPGAGDRA